MSLEAALLQSARACEGAAVALAHTLRIPATSATAPPTIVDTYREAEAFAITVRAVMDEAAPLLPLLSPTSTCVGRAPGLIHPGGRVHNGFDTIAVVLQALFDTAVPAILDVAAIQTRWLVSPLQAGPTFEKMVTHHGQLRALYGIIHLAAKIVARADTDHTLFVDVSGAGSHPELEPAKWRAAIKMDDFYGRHFGFHYAPEMRNVLRVVNIARGSIHKSHADDDPSTSPLIKNMTMLGWGWVYSNMVLMNNLGLNIDGVSQIGADNMQGGMSIQALRKFMNLVEEPLVAGVSGLASTDVAVDRVFEIPAPGESGGLEPADSAVHSEQLREVLATVHGPVSARLMSARNRPISLPSAKRRQRREDVGRKDGAKQGVAKQEERKPGAAKHGVGEKTGVGTADGKGGPPVEPAEPLKPNGLEGTPQDSVMAGNDDEKGGGTAAHGRVSVEVTEGGIEPEREQRQGNEAFYPSTPRREAMGNTAQSRGTAQSAERAVHKTNSISDAIAGAAESSYLASTIKTELFKLQSNVSSFLGIEEAKSARGLIVHFHGGGFVSQSSESHAVYMKEWCADVADAVLLSIDYKLAPEYRFPVAVHECLYAYVWALQNAGALGTKCERVVFAGDSAGGNLAVATALLAQQLQLRGPDGICVAYPALYVKVAWSPSRLLSFFDPLLPLSVLELCVKSYLPEGGAGQCATLSPVVAEAGELRALPGVTMVCGSLDPLLDDAVLFADQLRKAGRNGDVMRVYEAMPHGFLNLNQVNVTARSGMRFMAKKMAEYLGVPLRRGSGAEEPDAIVGAGVASAAVVDG